MKCHSTGYRTGHSMLSSTKLAQSAFRSTRLCRRFIQRSSWQSPPLAFVFDIDGVLIRGPNPLPAGRRALQILEGDNPLGMKIPYILLTNGGGAVEQERAMKLSNKLGVEIKPEQCIQAHTILQRKASKYGDKHVLVLGGRNDEIRKVAEHYGFQNAHTTLDVLSWDPAVWPFHKLSPAEKESTRAVDFSKTPISAIFVFHDPRNWVLDIQVICDVIQSGGIIGGPYISLQQQINEPVELVFCNPDLIWRSDFPRPRLGQGAFKEAFQAVYKALTGTYFPHVQYGKPTEPTYKFAEGVLKARLENIYGPIPTMPKVYMIGDNPESDIAGANGAGWESVLVHTGVYDPAKGSPPHEPSYQAADVEKAVIQAISHECRVE
ncbi:HAD-like domain-containing protein [Mucidula mucida]|nr:HAD-like domain-containing protein [Mucidula mucida]